MTFALAPKSASASLGPGLGAALADVERGAFDDQVVRWLSGKDIAVIRRLDLSVMAEGVDTGPEVDRLTKDGAV